METAERIVDESLRASGLASRRQRTRDAMRAAGIEVLIAYGNGNHTFFQGMNPAWWLTGFKQMGPHSAVVLPLDSDPFLISTPRWDDRRARDLSTIDEVISVEPLDFMAAVGDELQKRQLRRKPIAVTGGGQQPRAIAEGWAEALDQTPGDADQLVSDLARIRDGWSLSCVSKAAEIAERGYNWVLNKARPGMYEHQIAAELDAYLREQGADDNFQLLSASHHNRLVHSPTNRLLAEGDILLAEISPSVEGEYAQICRSAVFGKPTQRQLDDFALLNEALQAGLKAAKPETPVKLVVEAINAPIERAGYGKYTVQPYMRTRGHSMGLGSMDPEIAPFSGHVLKKNMVFVMHPNQYLPDTGYLMCGEPVIITDDGAQPLTQTKSQLHSIA